MPAYSFQKRFVPKVESGEKPHTLRNKRKRPTKVGDTLYLYEGLRTKAARLIRTETCTRVAPAAIDEESIVIDGVALSPDERQAFAISDGFENLDDFYAFWRATHSLPWCGELIGWRPSR